MFPGIRKRQKMLFIPKGNVAQNALGYRPLYMIDTAGKLLERIICKRLEALLGEEGLSDAIEMIKAIGKDAISGKSWLEDGKEYCAIITLDIKNAFNSVDWDATRTAQDGKDVPMYLLELIRNYFKDRVLIYDTDDGRKSYAVSAGVP